MDRHLLILVFVLLAIVVAAVGLAAWNSGIAVASAKVQTSVTLERQPGLVRAATAVGATLVSKVVTGLLVTIIVALAGWAWAATSEANRLKSNHTAEFIERRSLPFVQRQRKPAPPMGIDQVIKYALLRDLTKK